jgi:Ca2+/Na+ antiporter
MKILDYLFFRTYSFYKKKRDRNPEWMGALVLTVLSGLSLLTINALISIITKSSFSFTKIILLVLFILFLFLFWRRYGKSGYVKEVEERYKDEELNRKRLRGWLFILYLILVMLIPISVGYMRHNLGMDI